MEQQEQLLLEPLLNEGNFRRRELLPLWMKIFIWIFMVIGTIAIFCLIGGLAGASVQLALYGLETTDPLSLTGLVICGLFLLKGVVSFGLWNEKEWAVKMGVIDAIIGIAVCVYVMILPLFVIQQPNAVFTFRLELVALIPYFIKLLSIRLPWQLGSRK